jgi:hypothetical protein
MAPRPWHSPVCSGAEDPTTLGFHGTHAPPRQAPTLQAVPSGLPGNPGRAAAALASVRIPSSLALGPGEYRMTTEWLGAAQAPSNARQDLRA